MHYRIDYNDIHIDRIIKFSRLVIGVKLFIIININPPKKFAIIHIRKIRIKNGRVVGTTEITT